MADYVDTLTPAVISTLPRECQLALADHDIQGAAVTLIQCEMAFHGDPAIADLLHEVAHTYAAASTRIMRLSREPVTPPGE